MFCLLIALIFFVTFDTLIIIQFSKTFLLANLNVLNHSNIIK